MEELATSAISATQSGLSGLGGPALVGAGVGVAQSLVNSWLNKRAWDRNNAYNTPSAQKQRLLDAGLNPALMYSNGSVSVGNSSSPQKVDSINLGSALDALSAVASIKRTDAEIKNINASRQRTLLENRFLGESFQSRIDKAEADASKAKFAAVLAEHKGTLAGYEVSNYQQMFDKQLEKLDASIKQSLSSAGLSSSKTAYQSRINAEGIDYIINTLKYTSDLAEAKSKIQSYYADHIGLTYWNNLIAGDLDGLVDIVAGLFGKGFLKSPARFVDRYVDSATGEILK